MGNVFACVDLKKINFEQKELRIYWTDFHHIFTVAPIGNLILDCRLDPLILMAQETLPWQPILGSKLAKSDYSPLFATLAFQNELQYRHSDFFTLKFICDDLCVNLVKVGPVTPEFTKVKDVHCILIGSVHSWLVEVSSVKLMANCPWLRVLDAALCRDQVSAQHCTLS